MANIEQRLTDMEDASADQTSACQTLTTEVSDKMGSIDAKVATTAANIMAGLEEMINPVVIYLDKLVGSDDNDGFTSISAVVTISKALSLIPDGGLGYLYLMPGQTYPLSSTVIIHNRSVVFYKYNDRAELSSNPHIDVQGIADATHNHITGQINLSNGSLKFDRVNITLPNKTTPGLPRSTLRSCIISDSSNGGHGMISAIHCTITFADGSALARCYIGGNYTISLQSVVVTGDGFVVDDCENGTVTLGVYAVIESNGAAVLKGLRTSADGTKNILTNYTPAISA